MLPAFFTLYLFTDFFISCSLKCLIEFFIIDWASFKFFMYESKTTLY